MNPLPGELNYYSGNDPHRWRTGISTFSQVQYTGVYPGIDLMYYGNQRQMEYDFRISPRADFHRIAWVLQGIDNSLPSCNLDAEGNLLIGLDGGVVRLEKPVAYDLISEPAPPGNDRRLLDARYRLDGSGRFGFTVSGHDPDKTLVIDPVVQYSTYLGGSLSDEAAGVAVDSNDNVYVTGQTFSADFPTLNAYQGTCASCNENPSLPDVFVTEFMAAGNALAYSTFLGGSAANEGAAIAVDSSGNAYITGQTTSTDFPITSGAYQTTCVSCTLPTPLPDAFVTKLDASGTVQYSTFLGGSKNNSASAIAVDSSGDVYVTGSTGSTDFPTTSGAYQSAFGGGTSDAFVAGLDSAGATLLFSTYLGGSNTDAGYGIAVDSSGVYVGGQTASNNFPTSNAFQPSFAGSTDGFVTKVKLDGSGLIYSTYLGGTANNAISAIAINSSGNAYVTGNTSATDFPTSTGAFQIAYGGGPSDAFVTEVSANGSQLVYSTFLGGNGQDASYGIAVDSSGMADIAGLTTSPNFPIASPSQTIYAGDTDAFVTRFVPAGCGLAFSTYLGGHSTDTGTAVGVDASGDAYAVGTTASDDFPTQSPYQAKTAGDNDAFLARFNAFDTPAACLSLSSLTFGGQVITSTSPSQSLTLANGGNSPMSITNIAASGDFAQTNTCGNTLAEGANCSIAVTFSPTSSGARPGAITITDNAGGSPQSLPLSGIGTDFALSVSPATATVSAGSSASYTLTLTPLSGFNAAIDLTCSGAPASANCTLAPSSVTLNGSSATSVTVSVSTTARSGVAWFRDLKPPAAGKGTEVGLLSLLALCLLIYTVQVHRRGRMMGVTSLLRVALLAVMAGAAVLSVACGFTTNTATGTPAGSYSLIFKGADGSLQHTIQVTLTVN